MWAIPIVHAGRRFPNPGLRPHVTNLTYSRHLEKYAKLGISTILTMDLKVICCMCTAMGDYELEPFNKILKHVPKQCSIQLQKADTFLSKTWI